jgi:predicted  nucleic acid-binding Zn-ribbon protein
MNFNFTESANSTSEKALTKEEFNNYTQLRSGILNLKGKRSDIFDEIRNVEKQIEFLQNEFRQNQEIIESAEMDFKNFIDDLAKKYELGNGLFNISETEPHVIKIV